MQQRRPPVYSHAPKQPSATPQFAALCGLACSITAVVVSNVTGAVLYKEAVHVGPSAASPQGCPPAFQQLKAFCGSYAAAPPDYCCDELAALGSTCLDTLGSTLDADDLAAL